LSSPEEAGDAKADQSTKDIKKLAGVALVCNTWENHRVEDSLANREKCELREE